MEAYLCKTYESAKAKMEQLQGDIVTIECEWGDKEINGVVSLKHHGGNQSNLAPSAFYRSRQDIIVKEPVFIFSHLDADAIFGAMWVTGMLNKNKKTHIKISNMVEKADIYGPHVIKDSWKTKAFKKWITIGWLINRNNFVVEGEITGKVRELMIITKNIIDCKDIDHHPLFNEAYEWHMKLRKNALQYLDVKYKYVNGFISSKFMLSNYNITGKLKPFIIQYHNVAKRISISAINDRIAEYVFGERGMVEFIQEMFGEKAGGKMSIAGTPKGLEVQMSDYNRIKKIFRDRIHEKVNEENIKELTKEFII